MTTTPKQRARLFIVQALYQWQVTNEDFDLIKQEFINKKEGKIAKQFFINTIDGIWHNREALADITNELHIEANPVDLAILYLGIYELKYHLDTPYKVIISECLNLADDIGAEGSTAMINAVLDKFLHKFRLVQ